MITFGIATITFIFGAVIAIAIMERGYQDIADIYEDMYKKKVRDLERKYMRMINQQAQKDIFKEF